MEDLAQNEACYVFTPAGTTNAARPSKRRKVTAPDTHSENVILPPLFDGREGPDLANHRSRIYQDLWSVQEAKLQEVLREANAETVDEICNFLDQQRDRDQTSRMPAGFITAGLATSSSGSTLLGITEHYAKDRQTTIISLAPGQCSNLKSALKSLIQSATDTGIDDNEDEITSKPVKGIRLLNYDLQILQDFVDQKSTRRVIVHFKESESFDGPLLSELINVLSDWLDRIPFVLVFEIATSVELFQEKLSRQTLRLLTATIFEAKSSTEILDLLFRCATLPDESRFLWLGANASKLLLDRQTEHVQSAQGFITAMQYMYMLHFFNNPLSSLLCGIDGIDLTQRHITATRDLSSFKRYINDLIDDEENEKASRLQKDDQFLLENLEPRLQETRDSLNGMFYALEVLRIVYDLIPSKGNLTWSTLYIKAMSGDLADSTAIRELSLSIKRQPSDIMAKLVDALSSIPTLRLKEIGSRLSKLIAEQPSNQPLRTEHDASQSSVRTTVIAQKVSLSKPKAKLSAKDAAYSKIVNQIDLAMKEFLTRNIVFPKELILHEILVFDSKVSCRDVLGPSTRQAIERALSRPHDYLACECCSVDEGLQATQPATAIVYQLYLESGSLINVADLWAAFQAIVMTTEIDEDMEDEEKTLSIQSKHQAVFFRALAELRYLGMVRGSRKKADHISKVQWKGL